MLYASVHIVSVPAGTTAQVVPENQDRHPADVAQVQYHKGTNSGDAIPPATWVNSFVVGYKDDHLSHQWGGTGTIAAHVKT
jgi:hypothetical protein